MTDSLDTRFTIIGAGLAGSLMAHLLAEAGYRVDVHEMRGDPRDGLAGRTRSINLALSTRGLHALEVAGLKDEIMKDAVPMPGRMIHDASGNLSFQPYSKNPNEAIHSVSRIGLNIALINAAARHPGVTLHFNEKCQTFDTDTGRAKIKRGDEHVTTDGDVLIGADGAFSAVRSRMQRLRLFDYSQQYLRHGYKELTIPAAPDGSYRLEKHALHIWPRRSYMMIALPNADGSFTCTLFWPLMGPFSFDALRTPDDIEDFFKTHFPDAAPLMPTLMEDYQSNPVGDLVTIKCHPWHVGGRVVLIGDAAHAIVPFFGQVINAGFEDCIVLMECLKKFAPDFEAAFAEYTRRRKENSDTIADLAIENFLEMRDHVGSPAFLRKKRREQLFHKYLPNWYAPLYSMVTFSRIPYAEARQRFEHQERVINTVVNTIITIIILIIFALLIRSF
jgi:kynurenine 3-monooxygenase